MMPAAPTLPASPRPSGKPGLRSSLGAFLVGCACLPAWAKPVLFTNQVAYERLGAKLAVVQTDQPLAGKVRFQVTGTSGQGFAGTLEGPCQVAAWAPGKWFYQADFSGLRRSGRYRLRVAVAGGRLRSEPFLVADQALATLALPALLDYFRRGRADGKELLAADANLPVVGSDRIVDLRGGWCDASGDLSKYFSHLANANFMSPQQSPLTAWVLADVAERIPAFLEAHGQRQRVTGEALWGADYLLRALAPEGYFYMVVFGGFTGDLSQRRICGLEPDSRTTADYACSFRQGAGLAIAALARISRWHQGGAFSSAQYLAGAERGFAHLLVNGPRYCYDGRENIIDDYCALLAATELWGATGQDRYRDHARLRAQHLAQRLSPQGYFIADGGTRPFWHAADAGLPILALLRYLDQETEPGLRQQTRDLVRRALDYQLAVTGHGDNPFGYARQHISYRGEAKESFFIPHENETGWWWQGENARLGSLATVALLGRRVFDGPDDRAKVAALEAFASHQLGWILGCNPFAVCFMDGFGRNNPKTEASFFGHGPVRGGIGNGITGAVGPGDGSGIAFVRHADDGWRWSEQWMPHSTWFLEALGAMTQEGPRCNAATCSSCW